MSYMDESQSLFDMPSPIKKNPNMLVIDESSSDEDSVVVDSFDESIDFQWREKREDSDQPAFSEDRSLNATEELEPVKVDPKLEQDFKRRKAIRIKGRVVLSPLKFGVNPGRDHREKPKPGEWFNKLEDYSIDELYFVAKTLIQLHEDKNAKITVPKCVAELLSVAIVDAVRREPNFAKSSFATRIYFPILKKYHGRHE